jgi:hypothetical protein
MQAKLQSCNKINSGCFGIMISHKLVANDRKLFTTYHRVCNKSNTMESISGVGTAYPSVASECTPGFKLDSRCTVFNSLCSVSLIIVCPFVLFILAIVLSV